MSNETPMFTVNWKNFVNGLIMAVLGGIFLPLSALVQSGQFDIFSLNWHSVFVLAFNGALTGFVIYITKHFFSTPQGSFAGVGPKA